MRVYIGWDPRDELAFRACVASLQKYSTIELDIYPLKDHELRRAGVYWREYCVENNGQVTDMRHWRPLSTLFSLTRFAVPLIDDSDAPVLVCDPDLLWRGDIADLLDIADTEKAVSCVQHDHRPPETLKMDGVRQSQYVRKNWSSFMLMRPARCLMTPGILNTATKDYLHALAWQPDAAIGALPEEWNWLEGWSSENIEPKVVHYTRGTPDMLGNHLPFADDWWKAAGAWHPDMNHYGIQHRYSHRPPAAP